MITAAAATILAVASMAVAATPPTAHAGQPLRVIVAVRGEQSCTLTSNGLSKRASVVGADRVTYTLQARAGGAKFVQTLSVSCSPFGSPVPRWIVVFGTNKHASSTITATVHRAPVRKHSHTTAHRVKTHGASKTRNHNAPTTSKPAPTSTPAPTQTQPSSGKTAPPTSTSPITPPTTTTPSTAPPSSDPPTSTSPTQTPSPTTGSSPTPEQQAEQQAAAWWAANGDEMLASFSNGQCTDWAAHRRPDIVSTVMQAAYVAQLLGESSPPFLTQVSAYEWATAASEAGMQTGAVPRVGAIVVWQPGPYAGQYGHVAYVEAVGANGSFTVSEMSWSGLGVVDQRTVQASSDATFIY